MSDAQATFITLHVLRSVTIDQHMDGHKGEALIPSVCLRTQHYLARSVNVHSAAFLLVVPISFTKTRQHA